jgi:hypothetical protein
MKQNWQNFYGSTHCFQHGDLNKKLTWAWNDCQSSPLQTNSMQLSYCLPCEWRGPHLFVQSEVQIQLPGTWELVTGSNKMPNLHESNWLTWVALWWDWATLEAVVVCTHCTFCRSCQPVTLKDAVTVLSWHPLACLAGHLCKPLTLEEAFGPL